MPAVLLLSEAVLSTNGTRLYGPHGIVGGPKPRFVGFRAWAGTGVAASTTGNLIAQLLVQVA